jgi:hypothetical protein
MTFYGMFRSLRTPSGFDDDDQTKLSKLSKKLGQLKKLLSISVPEAINFKDERQKEYNEVFEEIKTLMEKMTQDVVTKYMLLYHTEDKFQDDELAKEICGLNWFGSDGKTIIKPCKHVLFMVTVYVAIIKYIWNISFELKGYSFQMMTTNTVGKSTAHAEPNGVELKHKDGKTCIHWEGNTIEEWLEYMIHKDLSVKS